jgi:GNAT superfamily N-acetyltransferase
MNNLTHGPACRPIRGVELIVRQVANGRSHCRRQRGENIAVAGARLGARAGERGFRSDRVPEVGRHEYHHFMRLVPADGPLLEQILDATYAVWHEGLTRDAYAKWNVAQGRTRWGAERLQRVALIDDDGRLLASAKRYLLDARLDGRDIRVLGIGAVFTQPEDRGRGYATRMLELLMDEARASGAAAAMLFSEIGTAF